VALDRVAWNSDHERWELGRGRWVLEQRQALAPTATSNAVLVPNAAGGPYVPSSLDSGQPE